MTLKLIGLHEHALDDKNRLVLPLGLRRGVPPEVLQQGFVLAAGTQDEFLQLFPSSEWEPYVAKISGGYSHADLKGQEYVTDLYASGYYVSVDKQYRFPIPDASRELAGIQKDVCMVGKGNVVLIYAKERWLERQKRRAGKRMLPPEAQVE